MPLISKNLIISLSRKNRRIQKEQENTERTGEYRKNRRIQKEQENTERTGEYRKNKRIQKKQYKKIVFF